MSNARDKANIPSLNFSSTGIDDNATSTAITIDSSERVGIGTASPQGNLSVEGEGRIVTIGDSGVTNIPEIRARNGTDTGNAYLRISSYATQFYTEGTEAMRIDPNGKIGIGTSTPSQTLHVLNGTSSGGLIEYDGQSNGEFGLRIQSNISGGNFESDFSAGTTALLDLFANSSSTSGGDLLVARTQSSTPILLVKGNGNVGIGTSSPSSKLHVETADSGVTPDSSADDLFIENSGSGGMTIGSGTSDAGNIYFGDSADNDIGSISYDHSNDRINFRTNTQTGFFMQTLTGVTITSSYADILTIPFGGFLIEIGSSNNNASREIWLVLRNGAAYSAATTRLLQRTGNDGPRIYNIRVPNDGILEAKLDSGSTITDAKITLFKFGM